MGHYRMIADKDGDYHRVYIEGPDPSSKAKTAAPAKKATRTAEKKMKRYYVVRSLGGHLFEIGDREKGGTVRTGIRGRPEAEKIARQMNRAGGYRT